MSKLAGIGEIQEGVLERDPLDDGLQLKLVDAAGEQAILRIDDMLSDYVGHSVRFTVGYIAALERLQSESEGVQNVSYSDVAKSRLGDG
jgi:predicted amino acid racemase